MKTRNWKSRVREYNWEQTWHTAKKACHRQLGPWEQRAWLCGIVYLLGRITEAWSIF